MTHTPGPWFYSRNGNPIYITGNWDKVAGTYADVAEIAQQEQSEAQANARLIAAAPDMLAALKSANCPVWVHNAAITNDIEALRRIALWYADWWNNTAMPTLAKATGEQP